MVIFNSYVKLPEGIGMSSLKIWVGLVKESLDLHNGWFNFLDINHLYIELSAYRPINSEPPNKAASRGGQFRAP